jgi:two-component system cell cycle response regulator
MHVGEELRQIVGNQPFEYEGDTISVTISIGVDTVHGENVDPLTFIKRADDKLYQAKRQGRNRVIG